MPKIPIGLTALILAVLIGAIANVAVRAQPPCDPNLNSTRGENGYKMRQPKVRCEGFFTSRFIRGGSLEPVSLLRGSLNFQYGSTDTLMITAPGTSSVADTVRVRAVAVPIEIHYRMDAVIKTQKPIIWPLTDVVTASRLSSDKIGVFGWVGRENDKTYIPLSVFPKGGAPPGAVQPLTLTVRSSVQINYLEYSINQVGGGAIEKRKKLIDQLVFPGEKIEIPIPDGGPAELLVTIRAREYQGNRWLPVLTLKIKRS